MRIDRRDAAHAGLALASGLALRYGCVLHPVWWLAWVAPAPLLVAALRSTPGRAFLWTLLAGLIAASGSYHYLTLTMPVPQAVGTTVLSALLWTVVVGLARRVMTQTASAGAVLAYPVCWSAADTLLAHLHPDGNWTSLAYSQAGFLPAAQIAALAGTAGLAFLLALVPAVLALYVVRGWRAARVPAVCTLVLVAAGLAYGWQRVAAAPSGPGTRVGVAVIDVFMGPRTPAAYNEGIWAQYERHVETLAGQGARIVVLPEKIAVLAPAAADAVARRLSTLARRTGVWLAAGMGIDDGRGKRNVAWLFAPDGRLDATYVKQRLAPPERDFNPGTASSVRTIGTARFGLAICKDMHFGALGRDYRAGGAQVMLVPAWDFDEDGVYAARLSALRGVESGFAMVRATREGLLTITDAYGRIVAEMPSRPMPGAVLLGEVPAGAPPATPYGRAGDLFGWLCVAGAAGFMLSIMRLRVTPPPPRHPAPPAYDTPPGRPSAGR